MNRSSIWNGCILFSFYGPKSKSSRTSRRQSKSGCLLLSQRAQETDGQASDRAGKRSSRGPLPANVETRGTSRPAVLLTDYQRAGCDIARRGASKSVGISSRATVRVPGEVLHHSFGEEKKNDRQNHCKQELSHAERGWLRFLFGHDAPLRTIVYTEWSETHPETGNVSGCGSSWTSNKLSS